MEESQNALNKERKNMNELKDTEKYRQRKVTTHSLRGKHRNLVNSEQQQQLMQVRQQQGYAQFIILCAGLIHPYTTGKTLPRKETLTLK